MSFCQKAVYAYPSLFQQDQLMCKPQGFIPFLVVICIALASCGGGGGSPKDSGNKLNNSGDISIDTDGNKENSEPIPQDINYGLNGRLYSGNSEFLDLYSGTFYTIAPQFSDSTTYPSRDGSEFIEVIKNYRHLPDEECYGFSIDTNLVAIRDANTGLISDSFELFEDIWGEARLSPDNQYVALFWESRKGCPDDTESNLTIFTRQGEQVIQANETVYDYDWLPDNRLVLLADHSIYVEQQALTLNVEPYPIPEAAIGEPNNIKASPDGTRVLFEMVTGGSSFFSTVSYRNATVWEFNLINHEFKQYITSRREDDPSTDFDDPQVNSPIWSPGGERIMATEDYTSGVFSTITPGDIFVGWEGWRDLIVVPLEASGLTYIMRSTEESIQLPSDGTGSSRPLFAYENNTSQLIGMTPFEEQAWVPSPPTKMNSSAGSLPVNNRSPNLGLSGTLYFGDDNDNSQYVVKQLNLSTTVETDLFTLSDDDTDEFYDIVYASKEGQFFALYHYEDLDDDQLRFFDREGKRLATWQLHTDKIDYSPYHAIVFSPDSSLVAFKVRDGNEDDKLKVVVLDWKTGQFKSIFSDRDYSGMAWTPNGDLLLFMESEIYRSHFSDNQFSDPEFLFSLNNNIPSHPQVSPNGQQIVFSLARHIWVVNIDGTQLRQLTAISDGFDSFPTWSPNGDFIIFQHHAEDRSFGDIWIVAADAQQVPVWLDNDSPLALRVSKNRDNYVSQIFGPVFWMK